MLSEGDRNPAGLCGGLEQPGLRVQRPGRDMARDPSLREGGCPGSELLGRLHQPGQRAEGGTHLRPVSEHNLPIESITMYLFDLFWVLLPAL